MDTKSRFSADDGYTLVELLVSTVIVMLVMGVAFSALTGGYRSNESARATTSMNNNLRVGMDLAVRDFIQVGQMLPTGRVVMIPSGTGAQTVHRPHGEGSSCTDWPAGTTQISAVTSGSGCGQTINGVVTDTITTLAGDTSFDHVTVTAADAAAHTVTIDAAVDITSGGPDDIHVGDLIMLTKTTFSTLLYVTAVSSQTITFGTGDPMRLNQFDASLAMVGTMNTVLSSPPAGVSGVQATRIRMISYYVDATIDPGRPRLVRHINWGDPAVAVNQRGRTVAFDVENLQFTYDLVDGDSTPPTGVEMNTADLDGSGACSPDACSPNQVRKINVQLAARSERPIQATREFLRNALRTQVSLRSLALVDRYR